MNARRFEFCVGCGRASEQTYFGSENGSKPKTIYYACVDCGRLLVTYADVTDAENLCLTVLRKEIERTGRPYAEFDEEELLGEMRIALWEAYRTWEPTRTLRFRSHGSWRIAMRFRDLQRRNQIRDDKHNVLGIRPTSAPVYLDAPLPGSEPGDDPVERAFGAVVGDFADRRSPDLARALASRGRREPREVGGMGGGPDA